jgi:transcriptional regulator with XRE-family HTH domain
MHNFVEWLLGEIDNRGWNQSELARRSGISHGRISQVISGEKPGSDFCIAVARAFNISIEEVLSRAGIIPLPDLKTAIQQEANILFSQLSDAEQEMLLTQMRALVERRKDVKVLV